MNEQKGLLTRLGETLDQYRAERRGAAQEQRPSRHPGWLRRLLPTPGNVLFTLLVVAGLFWANSVGALPLRAPAAASTSTGTIAYQGRLADADGNPLTDTYNMIFRLYDVASGGIFLWEELWTGSNSVQVSDGLFNVMLGSLTPIPQSVITEHDSLFLGITVGTDDEMTPRVQLGTVPFAVQALTVPDGSVTTEKIADEAVTQAKLGADVSLIPPDGSITTEKIADGAVARTKFASMTGIVWKTPPATFYEVLAWSPTENAIWDISGYLQQAGVPSDAEMILLGWLPSLISDASGFVLLDGNNQVLGSVGQGTNLPTLEYSLCGLEYGTPIPVPGATRKIKYEVVGAYKKAPTVGPRRGVIVFGWK